MRERPEDTGVALGLALGLHLAVLALMYFGWRFASPPEVLSVAGPPIEVELVQASPNRDRPRARPVSPPPTAPEPQPEAAPPPQPEPEPAPQDAMVEPQPAPQAPEAVPDVRDQDRVSRNAVTPKPPAPREQEERRRQEQIDLTERERQTEAEERQRRSVQQLERLKQLADLQRQRAEVGQQTRMDQQRLEQLRDRSQAAVTPEPPSAPNNTAQATPLSGNNGVDTSLAAAYVLAIQQAVERNWIRPETIPPGTPCRIRVIQIPGGDVISAEVESSCGFDPIGQRSLEAAVLRAQPLPFAGFESVFRRELIFTFRAPQD